MDELEYVNCNLCGSDDAGDVFSEEGFSIVKCRQCSLVYVNPRLTGESRTQYYVERLNAPNGEDPSPLPESDLSHAARVQHYYTTIDPDLMSALMSALQRRVLRQYQRLCQPAGSWMSVAVGVTS